MINTVLQAAVLTCGQAELRLLEHVAQLAGGGHGFRPHELVVQLPCSATAQEPESLRLTNRKRIPSGHFQEELPALVSNVRS